MPLRLPRAQTARPGASRWVGPGLIAVMVGGLVAAMTGVWRPGLLVVGVALAVAALLRTTLPSAPLGTLAVRGRWLDAGLMLSVGVVLVVAALALP